MALIKYKDTNNQWQTLGINVGVDSTPTSGSPNTVSSNGVYNALSGKQNTITSSTDLTVKTLTGGITYTTEAPTADNPDGVKIAILSSEPATKYNGWLYFIAEA